MCWMVVESESWKTADALCSTINVNPERSSERHNPRELIPIRAFHPALHSNSPPPERRRRSIIHCTPRRLVSIVPKVSWCLASRFPNCLETLGPRIFCIFEKGGEEWLLNGSRLRFPLPCPRRLGAEKGKRRGPKEGLSFLFFPFYDRDCNSCPVFKGTGGREGKMEKSRKGFVGNQK